MTATGTGIESAPEDGARACFVFTDRLVALDHRGTAWVLALADDVCAPQQRAWVRETAARLLTLAHPAHAHPGPHGDPGEARPLGASPIPPPTRFARNEGASAGRPVPAPTPKKPPTVGLRHDRQAYLRRVAAAQELIAAGESYELCLTNRIEVTPAPEGFALYRRLRATSPRPFAAYLGLGGVQVLSASPERFLRVTPGVEGAGGRVEARPIKGTRRRGATPEEDAALAEELRTDVKERAENLMIVDLLRHDLSTVCEPGSVEVPSLFAVETHAGVHQLVSTITGTLAAGRSPVAAVRAALPGGSMTGAPKRRSVRLLRDLEGGPRGVYSGVLGYVSVTGAVDLSIVIRTAVIHDGRLTYGVGGAITARSDPAAEWHETYVKAGTLARALDLDLSPLFAATTPAEEAPADDSRDGAPAPGGAR